MGFQYALIIVIPFFAGYLLDRLIGDPLWLPNPIRLINSLMEYLEGIVREAFPQNPRGERNGGGMLTLLVTFIALLSMTVLMVFAWFFNRYLWFTLDLIATYCALSVKKLYDDSGRLCEVLENKDDHGDLSRARLALSRITSAETENLDRQGLIKAGIAAVAEGTTRSAVAPMLFMAVGGGSFGVFYRAVDMLRARLVHDNVKYRYLGMAAEQLAAICDWLPSKLAGFFMRISAKLLRFEYGVRLSQPEDIHRARRVMLTSSLLCAVSLGLVKFLVFCFL